MINYNLISKSLDYYESKGFIRIETPWLVSKEVDSITRPANKESMVIEYNQKSLVPSYLKL